MATDATLPATSEESAAAELRKGYINIVVTYLIWGGFPLYFALVARSNPFEIVASRIAFSFVFCLVLLAFARQYRAFFAVFRKPRTVGIVFVAAILIAANWLLYVIATTSGHTLDASLGYFINPLVSVALGVIFLGEKLRKLQWVAIGIAAVAVISLSVLYGKVPWLGLGLAFTFGFYGLVKSRVGSGLAPLISLSLETVLLFPIALIFEAWFLTSTDNSTLFNQGSGYFWLLALSGVLTAVPLLTFGAATARLPLSIIGMAQYMTPTIQFFIALFIFHEELTPQRWIGFFLIWIACIVFAADMLRANRLQRKRLKLASTPR